MANRLINETSPYLLQHAHNPVDWYLWGEEALARARAEDRPILLSIGYSACHWCHVMERESFEDEQIAQLMNENFISIKVEDYSFLADGLLALYELTFDLHWLAEARRLADAMIDLFWEEGDGVFYDTGRDHESLPVRPRDSFDNATPCGGSAAVEVLLRMALLTGEESYRRCASSALRAVGSFLSQHPQGMGQWLIALDLHLSQPKEIALVGSPADPATQALLEVVYGSYLPNKVLACTPEQNPLGLHPLPLLRHRTKLEGRPTVYVCENYVCQLPVTEPEALARQLAG